MAKPRRKKPVEKGNHLLPEFGGFFGKTGSGKSHAMWKKYLEWQALDKRQTLVWSPKEPQDDYAKLLHCKAYNNMHELVKAARQGRDVVFVPSLNREVDEPLFNLFNRLAWALTPCCMMVDELHTITRATGGVPAWHYNTTMGRGAGLRVLASSQRPAHVDKDFFGAISYAWCGAQQFEDDAKTTARLVLCTPLEILSLTGHDAKTRSM
jgi:hypothetical protein